MQSFLIGNKEFTPELLNAEAAAVLHDLRVYLEQYAHRNGPRLAELSREEGDDAKTGRLDRLAALSPESMEWEEIARLLSLFVSDFEAARLQWHNRGSASLVEEQRNSLFVELQERAESLAPDAKPE